MNPVGSDGSVFFVRSNINPLTDPWVFDDESPQRVTHRDIDDDVPPLAFIFRLCVGVALFGIERHELILPDLPREVIDKRGRKSKRQKVMAKERRERDEKKCNGWLVGSEIDLPRPLVKRDQCREGTGTELQYGHIRSGHMRYQPCGPGNKDRKLIFLPPTVVRPDLPIRQMHGYRIKDPKRQLERVP